MVWGIVAALSGLLLADLIIRAMCVRTALRVFEHPPTFYLPETFPDPAAERISFPTTDGLTLRGSLFHQTGRRPAGLVVFCHEFSGTHWSSMSYVGGLWESGFDILAFDFRNQGESDSLPGYEPLHWLTEFEVQDVLSAIRYARGRDDLHELPLGLFGVSKGAGAALAAAARAPDVECVACDSAFSADGLMLSYTRRWSMLFLPKRCMDLVPDWHIRLTTMLVRWLSQKRRRCRYTNLESWLPRLRTRPVLLIAGTRDTHILPEVTETLHRRLASDLCEVWLVANAKHNMARQVAPAEYDSHLVEFFSCLGREHEPTDVPQTARSGKTLI